MVYVVRAAGPDDLEALYELAKLAGDGFTNLPPDKPTLAGKLARAAAAYSDTREALPAGPGDELFLTLLEDTTTGAIRGTAQIFAAVGGEWPFYSYRRSALTKHSRELGRTFRAEILSLVTDMDGASEVGGLFLHPAARAGGLGLLLARSRYLFIARHRGRFADRIFADLRGVADEAGNSPFWDGVAGRFFGMTYGEADQFNAIHGNQFIADLMPKYPLYVALLSDAARAAIGQPHASGRPAMRMLEAEGFAFEGYMDIFDAGPTMTARTDAVRSIAEARVLPVAEIGPVSDGAPALIASGQLAQFRCALATMRETDAGLMLDPATAAALRVAVGDTVTHVAR